MQNKTRTITWVPEDLRLFPLLYCCCCVSKRAHGFNGSGHWPKCSDPKHKDTDGRCWVCEDCAVEMGLIW